MSSATAVLTPGVKTLPRVANLSFDDFVENYLLPRKPVVIEGAIKHWRALEKWTPEFWKKEYGNRTVTISGKSYQLGEIIDLALASNPEKPAPYYRNIPVGHVYPELEPDISPRPIYSRPNWFLHPIFKPVRSSFMAYGVYELFIGGAGQVFPYLHFDVPGGHTFVYQIQGSKTYVLFSPADSPYMYASTGRQFNVSQLPGVDNVPLDKYPLYAKATRIETELTPGDMMFMPSCWWHTAKMNSFSVTLVIDLANETNWKDVHGFMATKAKVRFGALGLPFVAYSRIAGAYLRRAVPLSTAKNPNLDR